MMERHFAFLGVIALVIVLILSISQPYQVQALGCKLLRSYQEVVLRRETSGWPELSSKHFVVMYHSGDEESARVVLEEAERVYPQLGKFFGFYPVDKVPFSIYTDKVALNKVFGWGSEESAMGVYWAGVIRVLSPQVWLPQLHGSQRDAVFQAEGPVPHEYIHLLVDYKTRGNYTRWLTEGLAQYGEEQVAGVAPAADQKLTLLTVSLKDLDSGFDDPEKQEYSYAVSRDLLEYFSLTYGQERIPQLLTALGRGDSMDRAFTVTVGINLEGFLKGYQHYVATAV